MTTYAPQLDRIGRSLDDLTAKLAGVLQVTSRDAGRSVDLWRGFHTTMTGTDNATLWTPATGKRYLLKGVYIVAVVQTTLAAATASTLRLSDLGGTVVGPVCGFAATAGAGTVLTGEHPAFLDFREGVPGSAVGSTLQVRTPVNLMAGVIRLTGVAFGEEITR